MTTDFRALCAELVDYWENDCPVTLAEVMERARAAMAEPEPKGPTVMEIIELADEVESAGLGQVDLVRTALARWGQPL